MPCSNPSTTTTPKCVSLLNDALNKHLNGGCQVPIACYAVLEGENLWLRGLVGDPDGGTLLTAQVRGPQRDATALGIQVAEELLGKGAGAILQKSTARPARSDRLARAADAAR